MPKLSLISFPSPPLALPLAPLTYSVVALHETICKSSIMQARVLIGCACRTPYFLWDSNETRQCLVRRAGVWWDVLMSQRKGGGVYAYLVRRLRYTFCDGSSKAHQRTLNNVVIFIEPQYMLLKYQDVAKDFGFYMRPFQVVNEPSLFEVVIWYLDTGQILITKYHRSFGADLSLV